MIQQDPSLTPASVKARLMMSARKARFGDPLLSGAGYLDILGALRAGWMATDAPSPRAVVDAVTGQIAFENTAMTWGNQDFSLRLAVGRLHRLDRSQAYLDPIVHTDGEMWPSGESNGRASSGRTGRSGRKARCGPTRPSGCRPSPRPSWRGPFTPKRWPRGSATTKRGTGRLP